MVCLRPELLLITSSVRTQRLQCGPGLILGGMLGIKEFGESKSSAFLYLRGLNADQREVRGQFIQHQLNCQKTQVNRFVYLCSSAELMQMRIVPHVQ